MLRRVYILSVICDDWRARCFRVSAVSEIDAAVWAHLEFGDHLIDAMLLGEAADDHGYDFIGDAHGQAAQDPPRHDA